MVPATELKRTSASQIPVVGRSVIRMVVAVCNLPDRTHHQV
jgi:hypothetical protein